MALLIEKSGKKTESRSKTYCAIGIIYPLTLLFIFKYFNFFTGASAQIARMLNLNYPVRVLNIILPIGISFYTFQSLSYVIEVYRGAQKAEKNLGIFALYVMFFPQLVAGPIERPQNLLHQFCENHRYEYRRITDGLKLIAWGFFKKLVIADRVSIVVNEIYNNTGHYSGIYLILATVFFAYQIYCDFSGYSDIAVGSAQILGFRLTDNFNRPYRAVSLPDFWRRWHISLSSWFRDYLYIPLGGSRVARWRWQYNLLITFLISGLWHGANWTFLAWGCIHGLYILIGIWTKKPRERCIDFFGLNRVLRLKTFFSVTATFSLVTFAWIFFRANTLSDALYIVRHLFSGVGDFLYALISLDFTAVSRFTDIARGGSILGFSRQTYHAEMVIAVLSILFMELVHMIQGHNDIRSIFNEKPVAVRWAFYYILLLGILLAGMFSRQQFIYFRF